VARVKLDVPEKFSFSTEVRIRIGDINYGGHLGNDAVLSLVHEARVRFLKEYGYSEADIEGVGIIMTDAVVVYKAEGFHGDTLVVDVAVADFTRTGCDFLFRLTRRDTNQEIARAKTGVVFFDYSSRKVVAVPPQFRETFHSK
jgi:acyl-CoA thioesterase FadM